MGELSWQSSGKTAACALVANASQQSSGMINRLENADTGSSDLCLWVVWQNARLCSAPCQRTGEVASQAPSCSRSPSDVLEAAHLPAPLACAVVSLVTEQEPHPHMVMQGENEKLFKEHQSSPSL